MPMTPICFVLPVVCERWRDCVAANRIQTWESFILLVDVCNAGLSEDDIEFVMHIGLITEAHRRIKKLMPKYPT